MKREIKFRAWTGSKMLLNVGVHPFLMLRLDANGILDKDEDEYTEGENLITTPNSIDLMQFTGLRDKNGKEIYEGDVVEVWTKGTPSQLMDRIIIEFSCEKPALEGWASYQVVMAGNIYENPDLSKR